MKDEIKEIITRLKKENRYMDSRKIILCESEISILLDYITNLQEKLDFMIDRNDEKQERIDKAIEYIKQSIDNPQPFYEYLFGDENGKVENLDKLLNILNGGDDNE